MQHHKWDPNYIDHMVIWERDVWIGLLLKHLEEERKRLEAAKNSRRS